MKIRLPRYETFVRAPDTKVVPTKSSFYLSFYSHSPPPFFSKLLQLDTNRASLIAQLVKNLPAVQETQVREQKDVMGKE